jgi:hypothetical protein
MDSGSAKLYTQECLLVAGIPAQALIISHKTPVQGLRECCSSLWLACCKFWRKYLKTLMCVDAETGGLLEEASWLLDMGVMPNTSSASRGIGYQEVWSLFPFPLKHPVSISGLAMLLSG